MKQHRLLRCLIAIVGIGLGVQNLGAQSKPDEDPVPKLTAEDLAKGRRLFQGHCSHCHGIDGSGGRGPNLAAPSLKHAADNKALFGVIRGGLDSSEMPGFWQISDREVWQVIGYLRSIGTVEPSSNPGDPVR